MSPSWRLAQSLSSEGQEELLYRLCRSDFFAFMRKSFDILHPETSFLENWHIRAICHALNEVLEGRITRLAITVPPRNLKSICSSVALPAFALGKDPSKKLICVSYSEDLAVKLARYCRSVMSSEFYRRAFPRTILEKNAERELSTTRHGFRKATSIGGTLTGHGGDIIIIDDPMKPEDAVSQVALAGILDWYSGTAVSRLNNKSTGAFILVMQRLHTDDLAGHVLKEEGWVHLNLPAIAEVDGKIPIGSGRFHKRHVGDILHPARDSAAVLEQLKVSMGTAKFSAQYQQQPLPEDGNMLSWRWFQMYDEWPGFEPNDRIILSWDTAMSPAELANYTAGVILLVRGQKIWILEMIRKRVGFPELRRLVRETHNRYQMLTALPCDTIVENKGSSISLIQDLKNDGFPIVGIDVKGEDKVMRMDAQSPKIEAGNVWIPRSAPWLEDFRREVLEFPHGRYDDQIDALSQGLKRVYSKRRGCIQGELLRGPW